MLNIRKFFPLSKQLGTHNSNSILIRGGLNTSNFIFFGTLGEGSFGRVYLAKYNKNLSSRYVAIKKLRKHLLIHKKQVDHVINERAILKSVSHPFIVNYYGSFKDNYFLYIVLEYVPGGEFFRFLRKEIRLSDQHARFYAAQVTAAFEYLHKYNVIYRDLKPENMLIALDGYIKLTDFGFAKRIEQYTFTLCGTPEYLAPEILTNKGHGKPVDWWTLGILIYEMLAGYPPFYAKDPMEIYRKILDGTITFPRMFDREARRLIKHLLTHDLTKRYGNLKNGADDIKFHPWFNNFSWTGLLKKLLKPPYIPVVKSIDDMSNFEMYQEDEKLPLPVVGANDPFKNW